MGLKFHSKNRLKSLNTRHGTSHGGVSVYMGRDGRCTSASGTPARYSARRRTPRICPAITAFQGEPPSISAKDAAGPSPSSAPAVDHVQLVLRDIGELKSHVDLLTILTYYFLERLFFSLIYYNLLFSSFSIADCHRPDRTCGARLHRRRIGAPTRHAGNWQTRGSPTTSGI